MKGTSVEGTIARLFEGELETYVSCTEVDYTTKKTEQFPDITLDVFGCSSLEASLRYYTREDLLVGQNQFWTEHFGPQNAKKGVRFLKFPPVMRFHLKRIRFDMERMDNVKVNDRFEFPETLDLEPFCQGAGTYILHTVIVHRGGLDSGHFYCFIRPTPGSQWIRFDDHIVYSTSTVAAIDENFGGGGDERRGSAYILVYVKESEAQDILYQPDPKQVNPELVERMQRDEEENLKRL